ncbi:MAG: serine/threonine-protein kinase [Kofleriaceae bacterium]
MVRRDPTPDRERPTIEPNREIDPLITLSASPSFAPERTADPQVSGYQHVRDRDRYLIIGEHGRGGLGCVSRAHDQDLGRDVAIKELLSRSPMSEVRFLREALITARLEHPGIVPVYEAGRWPNGTPFYAMKLVAGRPLRELIAERATVAQRIGLLHHVIAVADALAYAHDRNIIHRDLKPANVIVGNFGETIVIDWGLAKDLGASDDELAGGPTVSRDGSDDIHLTSTGSVMGTAAYMPPEQERGEHVDQRADVFAIGAMLWELCSLHRVPPSDVRTRRKLMRQSGIEHDLAAIIDKAIDPDPHRRYANAGALAADLRSFKSGMRIAARDYSLIASVANWARRHRTFSIASVVLAVIVIAGGALYVRSVSAERDRADLAALEARTQQATAEQAKDNLLLQHSELLLQVDPTVAMDSLASYHGSNTSQLRRLRAEAEGRGVAVATLHPNADTIWFLAGDANGAIFSMGDDRKVRVTERGWSATLANNVSASARFAYAARIHRLAYTATPSGVAVLDLLTRTTMRADMDASHGMAISADGSALAALSSDGWLTTSRLGAQIDIIDREQMPGAAGVAFANPGLLVIRDAAGLQTRLLSNIRQREANRVLATRTFSVTSSLVIAGGSEGTLTVMSLDLAVLAQGAVCRQGVNAVRAIPGGDLVAFACADGIAGVARYDLATKKLAVVDVFATLGAAYTVLPDDAGRRVLVTSESAIVYVYDLQTRLVVQYRGVGAQISSVAAPSADFDKILVGDTSGAVRVWVARPEAARVVLQASAGVPSLAFSPDGTILATDGADRIAREVNLVTGAVSELRGHTALVYGVRFSPDGRSVVTASRDGTMRVWWSLGGKFMRALGDHVGAVNDTGYLRDGDRLASVGDDGQLLISRVSTGASSRLFVVPHSLVSLEVLRYNDHVVVCDAAGNLWDVAPDRQVRAVRSSSETSIRVLRASPDGTRVAIGTEHGEVVVYDTATWRVLIATKYATAITQIVFDPLGRDLVVASEDGSIRFVALRPSRVLPWQEMSLAVRSVAYSPDGEMIAIVCADGAVWFYDVHADVWAYHRDHAVVGMAGAFSPDGRYFASSDRKGVVVLRDVNASFSTQR